MTKAKSTNGPTPSSLADFARAKRLAERRAACAICALPDDLRAEIREERNRKTDLNTIIEWLRAAHKVKVTYAEFRTHGGGLHDQREE